MPGTRDMRTRRTSINKAVAMRFICPPAQANADRGGHLFFVELVHDFDTGFGQRLCAQFKEKIGRALPKDSGGQFKSVDSGGNYGACDAERRLTPLVKNLCFCTFFDK